MKKLLLFVCLLFTFCGGQTSAQDSQLKRKKVGLVLSGGGAKGAAHVGVIKVLEEAGIPIDIVTGTSIGSIVGGLYAMGYDAATMDSVFRNIDWGYVLRDRLAHESITLNERENQSVYILDHKIWLDKSANTHSGGFIKGINVEKMLDHFTTGYHDSIDFTKLPRPFACVAYDLVNDEEIVLNKGRIATAIRASMAIPGVFSPVRQDSMVLVDGGVSNNLPVDVAKAMGAEVIIAVTLKDETKKKTDLNTFKDIVMKAVFVASNRKWREAVEQADLVVNVNTHGYETQSFTSAAIDTLIDRGEATGRANWEAFLKLKKLIGVSDDYHPEYLLYNKKLLAEKEQRGLTWVAPEPAINIGLAARFDIEELAALQGYAGYRSKSKLNPGVDLTLRLGLRTKVRLEGSLEPWKHKRLSLGYEFQHNNIYMHREGKQTNDVSFNTHELNLNLFRIDFRNFQFDLGAAWKYYHLSEQLKNEYCIVIFPENTHYFNYNARLHFNSEDTWYFTTTGARLELQYKYFTDNLVNWKDHTTGFSALSGMWRITFPLSESLHVQPTIFGRMIFGNDLPAWELNMLGGNRYGIYSDHQIPFAGFSYAEFMDSKLLGAGLRLQQRLGGIGYLLLKGHVVENDENVQDLFHRKPIWGVQGAYYYNSLVGPLGAYLCWSNRTHGVYFGVNLGYEF